jgi:hypothetical protein
MTRVILLTTRQFLFSPGKKYDTCHIFALVLALLLLFGRTDAQNRAAQLETPAAAPVAKVASAGTFTDKDGHKHAWQVTPEHALLWNGTPYLPVGGTFAPRSLLNESEAAWDEDKKALDALKAKGLLDVIIWPERALHAIPSASLQRLLDTLEAKEFRYGLAFGMGLAAPLTGYIVRPAYYRHEDRDTLSATWQVANTETGLFTLVDVTNENRLLRGGIVNAREGVISVPTEPPAGAGRVVANLFPRKSLPAGNGTLPDIWSQYDAYRDKTLTALSGIKFGKGLRFFLDPLARRIGFQGEADYLVPDSEAFRLEFESFLARRYPNFAELKQGWGVTEGDFTKHEQLARLMPLWANDRGIPYFYDVISNNTYRVLDTRQSRWWQDFIECRNESVTYAMNAMATALKRQIAEVPVVYTWTQMHPMFLSAPKADGYDGLGITVNASGSALLTRTLGPAYSSAEQSGRTLWSVATEVVGTPAAVTRAAGPNEGSQNGTAAAENGGYGSQTELFTTLDGLRRIGVKGFFAEGFQTNPSDAQQGVTDWMTKPERLDWLREYATRIEREPNAARYAPRVLFFPQTAPGPARIGLVPGTTNVYWLNAFTRGEILDWWPSYSGYIIRNGDAPPETVLVSLQGPRKTHLQVPDPKQVRAFTPDGDPVPLKIQGKDIIEVTLDTTPVIFRTGGPNGQRLVPKEAAEDILGQLGVLVQKAIAQKLPAIDAERAALDRATTAFKTHRDYDTAYTFARSSLDGLTFLVAPYIWLEGELTYQRAHTFNEIAPHVEASGGGYLRLSTPNAPSRIGYGAPYVFDVPEDGSYTLWLAGTVPGPNTSPIRWRINTEPEREVANPTPQGPLYLGDRFGWIQLGTVNLQKGPQQSLRIYVTDRAASPQEYIFSIDAILLTRSAFAPNGPVRPAPIDAYTLRNYQKTKKD